MREAKLDELSQKLDVVARLLALSLVAGKTQTEQILLLSKAGLQPKEIAEFLGTTASTVRVGLSQLRKRGRLRVPVEGRRVM